MLHNSVSLAWEASPQAPVAPSLPALANALWSAISERMDELTSSLRMGRRTP